MKTVVTSEVRNALTACAPSYPRLISRSAVALAIPGRFAPLATSNFSAARSTVGSVVLVVGVLVLVVAAVGAEEVLGTTLVVDAVLVGVDSTVVAGLMTAVSIDVGRPAMAMPARPPTTTRAASTSQERFIDGRD